MKQDVSFTLSLKRLPRDLPPFLESETRCYFHSLPEEISGEILPSPQEITEKSSPFLESETRCDFHSLPEKITERSSPFLESETRCDFHSLPEEISGEILPSPQEITERFSPLLKRLLEIY